MLTVEEIQQALHASRVMPLPPGAYHGPLGLEHLAAIVARLGGPGSAAVSGERVRRVIELDVTTWEKLDRLARSARQSASRPVSVSQVVAAILEQFAAAAEGS